MKDEIDALAARCARRIELAYSSRMLSCGVAMSDDDLWRDVEDTAVVAMSLAQVRAAPKYAKKSMRELYRSFARSSTRSTMAEVRDALLRGVLQNPAMRLRDVREELRRVGIRGDDRDSVVRTLINTQSHIAGNAATWLSTIDDPDVWGYRYVTADDERVRPAHWKLHGVRYPKRHWFWRRYAPPNGWNCRCKIVPIYFGSRLARQRAHDGRPDVDEAFLWNPGRVLQGI